MGLCAQNRHIVNAKLCAQGFAQITAFSDEWQGVLPPYLYPIQYGQKFQYVDPLDAAEYLSENETILVQQVCGTFLYYSIAINNNIIPALSNASS